MSKIWKPGEVCYLVENNFRIVSGQIRNVQGEFCMIVLESGQALRLRRSRLYETEEAARKRLPNEQKEKYRKKTIYDYGL